MLLDFYHVKNFFNDTANKTMTNLKKKTDLSSENKNDTWHGLEPWLRSII